MRPGTENLLAVIGGTHAIERHDMLREQRVAHMRQTASVFAEELARNCEWMRLTVPLPEDVPGIVSFYFENVEAQSLLAGVPELCLNRGASCLGAGGERYSHVPQALGLPVEVQANILRASFGDAITGAASKDAARLLDLFVRKMRKNPPK